MKYFMKMEINTSFYIMTMFIKNIIFMGNDTGILKNITTKIKTFDWRQILLFINSFHLPLLAIS